MKNNIKSKCPFCEKEYTRKGSFEKHKITCEFLSISKKAHKIEEEETNNMPTYKELVAIVQQLALGYNAQKLEIQYLKKLNETKKKKINVIQWLNGNVTPTIDFVTWKNQLTILLSHLTYLFDNPIVETMSHIFQDIIQNTTSSPIPIYSFSEKPSKFYIYSNHEWIEMSQTDISLLFKKIQNGLLQIISKWKNENLINCHSNDRLCEIYNKTVVKIMSISLEPDFTFNKLVSNLFNILKVDIKQLVEFEFEF